MSILNELDDIMNQDEKDKIIQNLMANERKKVTDPIYWNKVKQVGQTMANEVKSTKTEELLDKAYNETDPYKIQVWWDEYNDRRGTPGF